MCKTNRDGKMVSFIEIFKYFVFLALINLLKFVLSNETYLVKKHDIFLLSSKVRQRWWILLLIYRATFFFIKIVLSIKFFIFEPTIFWMEVGSESCVAQKRNKAGQPLLKHQARTPIHHLHLNLLRRSFPSLSFNARWSITTRRRVDYQWCSDRNYFWLG